MEGTSNAEEGEPDPQQREAIEHLDGHLLLLAPVGSGKTRTLAARVVRATQRGIEPSRILCVTFTNRAAEEMRSRVRARLPQAAARVHVSTFHGLCARFLQVEHRRLGLPADFSIVDETDQDEILQTVGAHGHPKERGRLFELLHAAKSPPLSLDREDARLHPRAGSDVLFAGLLPRDAEILSRYQRVLADRQAVDFEDLVRLTRALLRADAALAAQWAGRYDLVQVDEVQDAHESEYEVVRAMARGTRTRLALIGDVDQTIYGWRGSEPRRVLDAFRRDFAPVATVALRVNHRATKRLVRVANAVLDGLPGRTTQVSPAEDLAEGDPVVLHTASAPFDEAAWIAARIAGLARTGIPLSRIGVLARRNALTRVVGSALARAAVPHVTVEDYEFFRRQEVKDAVALLRLILRADDSPAAERAIRRPARGLGDLGLARLRTDGAAAGLRLSDLLGPSAVVREDPFRPALSGLSGGTLVALDVETTGLDPGADEVIEVGAVRLESGRETERFHAFVRPTRPVGESVHTHGLTDERLAREGRPAAEAFADLAAFVGPHAVVGHNVGFDASLLESHAGRVGVALRFPVLVDTLSIARRFLDLPSYDLASVVAHAGASLGTAHRALDDARASGEVLSRLGPRLAAHADVRAGLMATLPDGVVLFARALADLRVRARTVRPAVLLEEALSRSGLAAFYEREPIRRANLTDLHAALLRRDLPTRSPVEALRDAVRFASLAKNLVMDTVVTDRVPVVTVHQAKGLEFDAVFVAGAVDDEFPSWFSKQDGGERLREEQRLFYVAVTRARRLLFLSTHATDGRSHLRRPSPYLHGISPADLRRE